MDLLINRQRYLKYNKVIDNMAKLLLNNNMRDEDIKNLIENIKMAKAEDSNIEIKSAKGGRQGFMIRFFRFLTKIWV